MKRRVLRDDGFLYWLMRFLEALLLHESVIVAEGRFLHHDVRQSCAAVSFRPDLSGISHGVHDGDGLLISTAGRWAVLPLHHDGCAGDAVRPHHHLLLQCSRDGNLFKWPCDCDLIRVSWSTPRLPMYFSS